MNGSKATLLIEELKENWQFRQTGKNDWHPARVPGCVQTDLLSNGLIDDPFYRDNEKSVQWIENENWEYTCVFGVSPELFAKNHIELVFEGLDTYATVFLNGTKIFEANNMFFPWQVDVKPLLKESQNEIRIEFRSPVQEILPIMKKRKFNYPAACDTEIGTSPHTRKAPYHYGWDWGPRLVTMGVWQPVKLIGWGNFRIESLNIFIKRLDRMRAKLEIELEIFSDIEASALLKIADDKKYFALKYQISLHKGMNKIATDVEFSNPQLWWPNGYGKQPLYTILAEVETDENIARLTRRIGLRTLELRRHDDEFGQSFVFVVNSIPIFAKGANWIPADSFTNRVSEEKYRYLLTSAIEANMNMVRIWGGGIYESETFYNLCDELGILVWQDFMFACSMYPADNAFVKSVEMEATYQIRRLRHHPSIVMWCGNNEIEGIFQDSEWSEKLPESAWHEYVKVFAEALPAVCEKEDRSRPYWPTSPGSDVEPTEYAQNPMQGDTHYWGVWHGREPFDFYRQHFPRFISEYGFQSFPEKSTINKFTIEEDHDIFSPVMLNHQKNQFGNALIKEYMEIYYRVPEKFDDFILLSQIQQAEAIKIGAEHFRHIRPRCMGSLYWQLNDCWPVASWSSIDYYGKWKALHYFAKRFYAPILISPFEEKMAYQIYVISDEPRMNKAIFEVKILGLDGSTIFHREKELSITPLRSVLVHSIIKNNVPEEFNPQTMFLYCSLKKEEQLVSENILFFTEPVNLQLAEPKITVDFSPNESGVLLKLESQQFVHTLALQSPELEGHFEDNFFHLLPGQQKQVQFKTDSKIPVDKFKDAFKYISLNDLLKNS